jgi:hypothetical protein
LLEPGNRRAGGGIVAGMFVDYIKVEVQTWLFAPVASLAAMMQMDTFEQRAPQASVGARTSRRARPAPHSH